MAKRENAVLRAPDRDTQTEPQRQYVASQKPIASPVGPFLRAARVRHGLDLEDVATALRIRVAQLQAIEEGRFDDLPGRTYAVGFVRAYAEYLGLDGDEVVAGFRDEVSGLTGQTELHFPVAVPESRVPSGAILFVSLVLAATAYGAWYYLTMGDRSGIELIAEVPRQLSDIDGGDARRGSQLGAGVERQESAAGPLPAPLPVETTLRVPLPAPDLAPEPPAESRAGPSDAYPSGAGPESLAAEQERSEETAVAPDAGVTAEAPDAEAPDAEAPDAPAAVAAGGDGPDAQITETQVGRSDLAAAREKRADRTASGGATGGPGGDQASDEEEVAALPALPQIPEPSEAVAATPAQVFGKANTDARIVIHAKDESWVQVRDQDGELVLTRMLHAGDRYRVPNREGLRLLTGNAGGLEIFVDGRLAPPIGPRGAIRRDVALDVERLIQGTAAGN